jgi:fructokinase
MSSRLCIFGEVLFDHFPDGKCVLGGAPFNVAWHLQALGQSPGFISRVGNDAEGETVRAAMSDWGIDTSLLQTDKQYPTGRVKVTFNGGEPAYDIVHPCAYDAVETMQQVPACGLLYHGSLALREEKSQLALAQLKACRVKTVFIDVNLRPPWYQLQQVQQMLHTANWVKLNTDELNLLYPDAKSGSAIAADFLHEYGLDGLVLTHGAEGAELITGSGEHFKVRPEKNIKVVDTVGAGDAFASIIILGLCNGWPLEATLQRAQLFASKVVSNRGATVSDANFYKFFINQWNLAA